MVVVLCTSRYGTESQEEILKRFPDAEFVPQASKGRYFYFLGTKKDKKHYKKVNRKIY